MSFNGDLEHLPIVDVIQLLHATRKSGTLTVKGQKGEGQLVFNDGYIVSANHYDNSIRIGRILVEAGVITEALLDQALQEQKNTVGPRKPLIAALIENGAVQKEDAYRGLETLIELTIVEVLTWKTGTFTLDVMKTAVSDEYRYFPEKLHQDMQFHTENVLMDALRIYDEKKRDGTLVELGPAEAITDAEAFAEGGGDLVLSADDLGLEDLERLDKKIPEVFTALEDRMRATGHRRAIPELAPELAEKDRDKLIAFLENFAAGGRFDGGIETSVILFSADELMTYCLTAVCRQAGLHVFSTNEAKDLDPVIDQFLARPGVTVLVLDAPGAADRSISPAMTAATAAREKAFSPHLITIQLLDPRGDGARRLAAGEGVQAVLTRPIPERRREAFPDEALPLLAAFPAQLTAYARTQASWFAEKLQDRFLALRESAGVPGAALLLLHSVAEVCERSLTLIVRGTDLIAEKGIGIQAGSGREAVPLPGVRLPLTGPSLLPETIRTGRCHCGRTDDAVVREEIFRRIGAPRHPLVILLPLRVGGKTISLTYGDFGEKEPTAVPRTFLELLAAEAGLVLENAWYRKKLSNKPSA